MTDPGPDPLTAAAAELRSLGRDLRERGDVAAYRRTVAALAYVLAADGTATGFGRTARTGQPGYMTVTEYAALTGRKPGAIRLALRNGRLAGQHHGRIWLIETPAC